MTPQIIVLSSTMAHCLPPFEAELRGLAASFRLALAGAGVSAELAERLGAELLDGDPVTAAERLAAE